MIDYFAALKANFGDSICSPLTGGVHTRLMLGCMKRVGIRPVYMYIFGDPNNRTGRDANAFPIARSIAEVEKLELEFIDTTVLEKIPADKYQEFIKDTYYLGDGLAHEVGIFHHSFNPGLRLKRASKARLILNGAGGETFRNYWVLLDRPYSIDSFVKSRFDSMDSSVFSGNFDRESYFSAYQEKIKHSLDTNSDMLSRKQIELVQPDFENRYWMGNNNSINCQISHYLTPWADAQINYQACDIPVSFKDFSRFESALMRNIDPKLAKYPTAQGVDLMYDRMKMKDKMNNTARQHIPVWLKAYLRKHFYNGAGEHLSWSGNRSQLPYNFSDEYLEPIFPSKDLSIRQYFKIDSINNPAVLSRALTAELVINDRF
jgi:asparagine synthase (glutamine-hydrolysing)